MRRPDLVLPDVADIDAVLVHAVRQRFDERLNIHIFRRDHGALLRHGKAPGTERVDPFRMGRYVDLMFIDLPEHMTDVTDQRNRRPDIFSDFRGIDIDVHQHLVFPDQLGTVHGAVRDTRADHQQQIRLVDRAVRVRTAVVSHHAEIQVAAGGHHADAHHRGHDRNLIPFRKSADLVDRAG